MANKMIHGEPIAAATEGSLIEQKEKLFVDEVLEISNRWLKYLRTRQIDDIKVFYMMATDIVTVLGDQEKYGTDAAKLLLQRHGLEVSSLKIYKMVGQTITPVFLQSIIKYNENAEASRYGLITASHMVILAQLPTNEARVKTLKRIQENKWSVRALRDYVDDTYRAEGELDDRTKRRVSVLLGKAAKQATLLLESMAAIDADEMTENIAAVKTADLPKAMQKCREARDAIGMICENGEAKLAALDAALERLSQRHNALEAKKVDGGSGAGDRVERKARKKAEAMFDDVAEEEVEVADEEVSDELGDDDVDTSEFDDDELSEEGDDAEDLGEDSEDADDVEVVEETPSGARAPKKAAAKAKPAKAKTKRASATSGAAAGKRGRKSRA